MDVDAQYRALVSPTGAAFPEWELRFSPRVGRSVKTEEAEMARGLLLWLLGVPIPVIILLWLFFGH